MVSTKVSIGFPINWRMPNKDEYQQILRKRLNVVFSSLVSLFLVFCKYIPTRKVSLSRIILIVKESSEQLRMSIYLLLPLLLLLLSPLCFFPFPGVLIYVKPAPLSLFTQWSLQVSRCSFFVCCYLEKRKYSFVRLFVGRINTFKRTSRSVPKKWAHSWKSFRSIKIYQNPSSFSFISFQTDECRWATGSEGIESLTHLRKMKLRRTQWSSII